MQNTQLRGRHEQVNYHSSCCLLSFYSHMTTESKEQDEATEPEPAPSWSTVKCHNDHHQGELEMYFGTFRCLS